MKYYVSAIKNYINFSGRAMRKEYWMFILFNLIFCIVAAILDNIIGDTFRSPLTGYSMGYGYIYLLYGLFVLIPGLAAAVRRLHDVSKSGWFMLVILIPLAGAIWLLVLLCKDSTPGVNKYGQNPKEPDQEQFDFMKDPATV